MHKPGIALPKQPGRALGMLKLKPKPTLFVLFAVILAMALTPLYGFASIPVQDQLQKQSSAVEPTPLPTVEYSASEPASLGEENIRGARSGRHDKSPMNVKELPPNVDQLPIISHFWWGLSSIPTEQSDAVIVGEVVGAQAYLSNDKTGVYSEFTVRVEQTLKAPSGGISTSIVAERPGGAVRFPSGRIVRYEIHNQGMPKVGSRYLLFLKYNTQGDDFCVLTGYALKNGRVVPLDNIEHLFAQYKDWSESAFHSLVNTTIKGRQ